MQFKFCYRILLGSLFDYYIYLGNTMKEYSSISQDHLLCKFYYFTSSVSPTFSFRPYTLPACRAKSPPFIGPRLC